MAGGKRGGGRPPYVSLEHDLSIPHGTAGGYTNHHCRCSPCTSAQAVWQRSYQKDFRKTKTAKQLEYLLSHPCVDCGEKDPVVLEFDHVRGVKEWNVSLLVRSNSSWKRVLEEIEKCEVVCANCHKRRTAERCPEGWAKAKSFVRESSIHRRARLHLEKAKTKDAEYRIDPGHF